MKIGAEIESWLSSKNGLTSYVVTSRYSLMLGHLRLETIHLAREDVNTSLTIISRSRGKSATHWSSAPMIRKLGSRLECSSMPVSISDYAHHAFVC